MGKVNYGMAFALVFVLAFAIAVQVKSRGMRKGLRMLLLLCVFLLGYMRMEGAFRSWAEIEESLPEDERMAEVSGQVLDIREKGNYQVLKVKTRKMGKVLVYVEDFAEVERIGIGQEITTVGKAGLFEEARNPGQFDLRKYYRAQGISMAVFAAAVESCDEGEGSVSPYFDGLYRLRRKCGRILGKLCREEDEGIFRAVILGEKEGMDGEIKDLYQKNGIAHLLAISGLHLSMLGMGFYRLLRKTGLGYGASGLAAGAVMVSYGLMTGGSGSALRAVVMLLAAFLASYLGRSYDLLSALSLSALLLAGSRPFSIGEAGFQLSFGAVLGIGLFGKRFVRAAGVKKGWQEALVSGLAIQMTTAPVVFWHYFQYPVYGIFLNLLVIPLMGYVILSGLLGIGLGWAVPSLGIMAVGSGHYILLWYQNLCRIFSRLPGYQAVFGRPEWGKVAAYYLILGVICVILDISGGDNEKYRVKLKESGRKWINRAILAAGLPCCFLCLYPLPQKGCDIAFLDVGQGDGIVIQWEGEKVFGRPWVVLVDGGSTSEKKLGENRLEPYLKSRGITKIDAAIVSHGDEDHISGLRYLLEECEDISVARLILPESGRGDPAYEPLLKAAGKRGTGTAYMSAGDRIEKGNCRFTCLYPEKGEEIDVSDRNQQSLIVKMDYGGFHLLLTGDTDSKGEERMVSRWGREELSGIQVLKAAHHGSRFSNSRKLLEAVSPSIAVISYETGNSYGHPHEETLERLEEAGCRVLKTGEGGAVLMHIEPSRGILRYRSFTPE